MGCRPGTVVSSGDFQGAYSLFNHRDDVQTDHRGDDSVEGACDDHVESDQSAGHAGLKQNS